MSFTGGGGTITQSGTDSDLSGIAGLSGVSTVATSNGYTAYDIGGNQLLIDGILTIDSEKECLLQDDPGSPSINIRSGGVLNVGKEFSMNGAYRYSNGLAIRSDNNDSAWDEGGASLAVQDGGTLNWYGGTISVRAAVAFMEGSTVNIYSQNAILNAYAVTDQPMQIRLRSTGVTIEGLILDRGVFTLIANPTKLAGIKAVHSPEVFGLSSSTPSNVFLVVEDYVAGGGSSLDVGIKEAGWVRSINAAFGSDMIVDKHQGGQYQGLVEHRMNVNIAAKDAYTNSSLTGFGCFLRDRDWSNRLSSNQLNSNPDYTADREYASRDSSGIVTFNADGGVLIAVAWCQVEDNVVWDYRGEADSNTDQFNIRVRKFGYLFQTMSGAVFKGVGGYDGEASLIPNSAITQDATTAQGHTGITVTDHGGSPASWQGKSWGITVEGDLSVNSSLTADDIYHYLQYHLAQVDTSFNGKNGGEWHNMLKPSGQDFVTENGTYGGMRTTKGVRVVDQNGNAFPSVVEMQADDGTTHVPPIQYSFSLTGLVSNSEVRIYEAGTTTELAGVENSGSSFTYNYEYTSDFDIDYVVFAVGYQPIRVLGLTLSNSNNSIPVQQVTDRVYSNP